MKRIFSAALIAVIALCSHPADSSAALKEAGSSLLLPTTGQAMNGQISTTKTKLMAGLEVAAITTVAVLGTAVGGGVVWVGLGPLLGNHVWSAADAYVTARKRQQNPMYQSSRMTEAQQTLDYSRQRRFEREQEYRGNLRDRLQQAAEVGYYS